MPSKPPSRPKPEAFTPPNGAAGLEMMPWLMPIIPYSSASLTRMTRPRSLVKTYEASPYSVPLALLIASASVRKVLIGATGPKISSLIIRADIGTPVMTVVKVEIVASAEQAAAAAQQKKEEPAPRGLGGLGARLGARALGRGNDDNAAAATPGRATVMTSQHELLKVTPAATDADVAVPAGFKLKS